MIVDRMLSISLLIKISLEAIVRSVVQHVPSQQLFVERAGDLGDKNRVVVILERLILDRIMRVHRVTGFVSQRENIIQNFRFVVHHDVRVTIVSTVAERTTLLARVRIAIAPASGTQAFTQRADVLVA